jgi:hypothetical protein
MDCEELWFLAAEAIEVDAEVVGGAVDPLFEVAVEENLAGDTLRLAEESADALEGKAARELVAQEPALLGRQFADGSGRVCLAGGLVVQGEGAAQTEDGGQSEEGDAGARRNGRTHGRPRRSGGGVVAFMIREVGVVRPNERRKTSGVRVRMEYPGRARNPSPQ